MCQNRAIKKRGGGTVSKQPFQFNCLSVSGRGMWHTWYRIQLHTWFGWKTWSVTEPGFETNIFTVALPPHQAIKRGEVFLFYAKNTCRDCGGIAPLILNLDIRLMWVVNFMAWPLYPFMTSVNGPYSRPEHFREEKNLLLLMGFERRSVQPVAVVAVTYTAVWTTTLWRCDCSNRGIVKVWAFMRCLM